jgi:hypothetical protein
MSDEPPIADAIRNETDAPPLGDVTQTIPDAGIADLELHGLADDVDVTVIPVRAPETPEDVELVVDIGRHQFRIAMAEDDALALDDAIHTALETEALD